jgi:hypothetical protein
MKKVSKKWLGFKMGTRVDYVTMGYGKISVDNTITGSPLSELKLEGDLFIFGITNNIQIRESFFIGLKGDASWSKFTPQDNATSKRLDFFNYTVGIHIGWILPSSNFLP